MTPHIEAKIRRRVEATRKAAIRRKLSRLWYRRGLTQPQIGDRLGISKVRVQQFCAEINLKAADLPRPIYASALVKAARNLRWHERMIRGGQMVAMYRNGATQAEVAAKFGINQGSVGKLLRRRRVTMRPGGWPLGKPRKPAVDSTAP